jgi:hypothetical protein
MSMEKNKYGIIVAAGLVLTIMLSSIFTIGGTHIIFAQGPDQQENMGMVDNMDDKMMMRDANMSSSNMSDMMMTKMMDMMDRMNKMMDMMMMDMPMDTNDTNMMSMSNGNIDMGSMQNQTGEMMR